MLKIAVLAVAATISAPGYSASVDDADVSRLVKTGEERAAAFQTLVEAAWIVGEAQERGIVVSDPTVEREERISVLRAEIQAQVTEPAAKSVTPDQVKAYVDANPKVLPAGRTVRLVLAKNRARAMRIERRLERGATWAAVGGHRDEFAPGKSRITRAIFRAKVGEVTRYGRVVFEVAKHTPERPMPRAQQEALAWEELASRAQQQALDAYTAQFTEKWRARTSCAAKYAQHPSCAPPPNAQHAP